MNKASAFGMAFLKNAKNALEFSKKKITEAVELAQEKIHDHPSPRHKKYNFEAYAPDPRRAESPTERHKGETAGQYNRDKFSSSSESKLTPPKPVAVSQPQSYRKEPEPSLMPNLLGDDSPMPSKTNFNPQPSPAKTITPISSVDPSPKKPAKPIINATSSQLQDSDSYKEKGNAQFKAGQYADAEALYTSAIQCLPENHLNLVALFNNRAGARLKTGAYTDAVQDCNKVQELEPNEVKSLLRRATAFEALEKWEDAQSDYRKIMILDSSVKGVSLGLARCAKALAPVSQKSVPERKSGPSSATPKVSNISLLAQPQPASNHSDHQVKQAVDEAVQSFRAKSQQAEQEEALKFALKDKVDDKVMCFVLVLRIDNSFQSS
jgi:tetratricopeptide (TPR) repeat protein